MHSQETYTSRHSFHLKIKPDTFIHASQLNMKITSYPSRELRVRVFVCVCVCFFLPPVVYSAANLPVSFTISAPQENTTHKQPSSCTYNCMLLLQYVFVECLSDSCKCKTATSNAFFEFKLTRFSSL